MKRQPPEWDMIFQNEETDKGIIFKIYKQLMQLNIRKINDKIKKRVEDLNRPFPKEDIQMAIKHMEKMPNVTIREMQIKIIIRYHLTPVRMAIIKTYTNSKYWRGYEEKGTLLHC